MSSDNDLVEFIAAGPSKPRHEPTSRRRRRAPAPRRKAQLVPPQDIIEIQDSDEDEVVQPVTNGKGKDKAVVAWRNQVEAPVIPQRAPLFLPGDDSGM